MRRYTAPTGAAVEEYERGGSVLYTLYGTPEQQQAEADRLLERYPKAGYGTTITRAETHTAVERYASCE